MMMPVEPLIYGPWPRSGQIAIADSAGNINSTCNSKTQNTDQRIIWGLDDDKQKQTERTTKCSRSY